MAKAGATKSWTKIAEDGWDGKTWAVAKLISGAYTGKPGQHKFIVPKVAPGDYIIRPEIIALHEGNRVGGAQFYQECIHVKVGGSGTTDLPAGVAIPGYVTANTPGVLFDMYSGFTSYPIPGPKVWSGASGAAAPAPSKSPAAASSPAPAKSSAAAASPVANPAPTANPSVPASKPMPATGSATSTFTTIARPAATPNGGLAQPWGQCGGLGYTGPTACHAGCQCKKWNDWYSQCV